VALGTTQGKEREHDRNQKPEHVVDARTVSEHNHHRVDGIAVGSLPGPCTRFGHMKKALKVLLVIAIVGVIGKIIIDNA
jgi:hypothetical protein